MQGKGGCISNRCGCKKQSSHCGPGCECQNCKNLFVSKSTETTNPHYNTTEDSDIASEDDSDYDEDSSTDDSEADENIESELITDQTISYLDL